MTAAPKPYLSEPGPPCPDCGQQTVQCRENRERELSHLCTSCGAITYGLGDAS